MNNKEERYDFRKVEGKWRKRWEKEGLFKAVDFDKKPKKYVLFEFPYPSGARLHVGHGRSFTALDAMARKYRMQGFNVLLPMGWDAFGLPTENYAIKMGINPSVITQENIANSREQAKRWGLSIDWDREIDTTDPKYYKWTQWIFLKMFEKGLAYRDEVPVNWCPFCKTTLANEEVEVNGTHERCGKPTVQRRRKQWILRITKYADRLLEDLKMVDYLPKIALQQINWIGRSEGAEIKFEIRRVGEVGDLRELRDKENRKNKKDKDKGLTVFTTRPDTLFGATFMVVCPEHEIVAELLNAKRKTQNAKRTEEIRDYVENARKKSEMERTELGLEKTGVFSGLYAINPATGKEIPIWISDFVLSTYGTGAIMAVPAHDERDWQFAKKFGLPIVPVIVPEERMNGGFGGNEGGGGWDFGKGAYTEVDKGITVNCGEWSGLIPSEAIKKATEWLEKKGIGKKFVSYHLRDWIFSRQHYWGEPIPMIFCAKCASEGVGGYEGYGGNGGDGGKKGMVGWWPVPEDQLPVKLPNVEKYEPTETGESPLENIKDWVETKCPVCGGPAKRETDTMPNWAGSNWYFLRYIDPKNKKELIDIKKAKYWLPVDLYNGGMEHTTLHLLYSRFIYKFLYDINIVPTKEPYAKRRSHGMVLGTDGQKMSKSRGNTINPDEMIEAFGADTFRLYESFIGPFDQTVAWSQESMEGCYRFIKRVWRLVDGWEERGDKGNKGEREIERKLNQTIKKVGEDIEEMKFNTAVAAMMELLNKMDKKDQKDKKDKEILEKFLTILAPFAPYITEELWQRLGNKFSIHQQKWPEYDPDLIAEEVATIAVQVNGKLRGTIEVQYAIRPPANDLQCRAGNTQYEIEKAARGNERVKKYLEGQEVKKVIFVPGKLINFVV